MKKITKLILLCLALAFSNSIWAQEEDDLLAELEGELEEPIYYTAYSFKSTRIINGHSIERMQHRQLDFRINHRFGQINEGGYALWGLDNAIINFSFEYGLTDNIMIGLRRGTNKKVYDLSSKFTLLRQSTGRVTMPVSVSYYTNVSYKTQRGFLDLPDIRDADFVTNRLRMGYAHQLLIARKFTEALTIQLSPTYVHRNYVAYGEQNDVYALGFGGRYKFVNRVAFMWEYFYTSSHNGTADNGVTYYNPLAIGFDIETGGHVFQLFFTNTKPMVEDAVIAETTGNWTDGGIYFGFNMSRVFAIPSKKHH
ncbi:MAG: hypothetical protein JXQ87_07520 [Bacteroidia bacterium]